MLIPARDVQPSGDSGQVLQSRDWVDVDSGQAAIEKAAADDWLQSRDWVDVDSGAHVALPADKFKVAIPRLG